VLTATRPPLVWGTLRATLAGRAVRDETIQKSPKQVFGVIRAVRCWKSKDPVPLDKVRNWSFAEQARLGMEHLDRDR
jgi:hypothetical protein